MQIIYGLYAIFMTLVLAYASMGESNENTPKKAVTASASDIKAYPKD